MNYKLTYLECPACVYLGKKFCVSRIQSIFKYKGILIILCRYVPAYSTRLKFESGVWNVLPANTSDSMGVVDPVWTESNWNSIGIRVYTVQSAAYDRLVLLGGVGLTMLAYLAIAITRAFVAKTMKRD